MEDRNIDFVARHYSKGRFSEKEGWKRLGITSVMRWSFGRVAASVAVIAVLSAAAAIVWRSYVADETGIETAGPAASVEEAVAPEKQIRTIDFENAPLAEVVARISEVYGVSITDVPAEASDYRLSLHYEGNVVDLVGTINELLAIDLKIVEERNGDGR